MFPSFVNRPVHKISLYNFLTFFFARKAENKSFVQVYIIRLFPEMGLTARGILVKFKQKKRY